MTVSAQSSLKKMSWARGQSSGWSAFDLKQRKKNNIEFEVDKDPFPPVGSSDSIVKKNHISAKPFSSVLLPNKNSPPLNVGGNNKPAMLGSDSDEKHSGSAGQADVNSAINKLKEQHQWADNSLIDDILAAVDSNIDKASALLETMASDVANFEECKVLGDPRSSASDDYTPLKEQVGESLTSEKVKDDIPFHSICVGHVQDNEKDLEDTNASSGQNISDVDNLRYKMNLLSCVPVEPEWEDDDDIYVSHRKDALKMMRSASRHYRAASSAFMRGDHFSAQHHSKKAQEEWHAAEELNSEAAKKIFSLRNNENDITRLDLHGLHAAEAIKALQEHLYKIERHGLSKSSATSNGLKENGLGHSISTLGSLNPVERENLNKQAAPLGVGSLALHVITGVGNHSRGQAALPEAVRNFLSENRYRFEELRPGVITVWPKFRRS